MQFQNLHFVEVQQSCIFMRQLHLYRGYENLIDSLFLLAILFGVAREDVPVELVYQLKDLELQNTKSSSKRGLKNMALSPATICIARKKPINGMCSSSASDMLLIWFTPPRSHGFVANSKCSIRFWNYIVISSGCKPSWECSWCLWDVHEFLWVCCLVC